MSGPFDPYGPPSQQYGSIPSAGPSTVRPSSPARKASVSHKPKRPSFSDHPDAQGSSEPSGSKVRAYTACRNCRLKKVKCLPGPRQLVPSHTHNTGSTSQNHEFQPGPCQQCLQGNVECTYVPTRDRAAYSRQYVADLQMRVQDLEAFRARAMPMLVAYESQGPTMLPLSGGERHTEGSRGGNAMAPDMARDDSERSGRAMPGHDIPFESDESGDADDDQNMPGSDGEDAGQITQDERGNYRWIGSSNTLSLLDSFSHREDIHPDSRLHSSPVDLRRPLSQAHPPSRVTSSGHSPNTAGGSEHTPRNPYFGEVAGAGVVKALPPIEDVVYPSYDRAMEMIDAFFREIHPSLPVVLEHDFRAEYKVLNDARERGEPWPGGGFISVVFAVFALGERVLVTTQAWQRERKKSNAGEDESETVLPGEAEAGVVWYERAQILHYSTAKDINICQVQALTLMAAFQASVNAVPMSWLQAGKALRVAQDLGLHRSTARLNIPFAEKQLRARCWWAIYGLERLMSISLGRPLGVDDLDIDVALPAEIDDEGLRKLALKDPKATPTAMETTEEPMASTMSGFVALTKLCRIAGKVAHLLYRPSNGRSVNDPSWAISQQTAINKLDKHLRDWLEHEVPSKYKDPSSTHSVSLLSAILSNSYFAILITLHRNFLPSNPDYPRPKPPPSSQSLAHCADAARSLLHIGAQSPILIPPSHHLAMYCQYLWSSAVILLLCEVQARDQVVIEAVGSQVESCRQCLQALEPVWPGSRKLKELLNGVAARAKDAQVVDTAIAARPGKKRKSSAPQGHTQAQGRSQTQSQMPPPAYGSPQRGASNAPSEQPGSATAWQVNVMPGQSGQSEINKRPRLYETSDTRTINRDEPFLQPQYTPQVPGQNPMYYPAIPYTTMPYQTDPMVPFDMSFDLGAVPFDGLEMLQGFGDSASSFWNNLGFGDLPSGAGSSNSGPGSASSTVNPFPLQPNSTSASGSTSQLSSSAMTQSNVQGPTQNQAMSGRNTPTSAGGAAGPSPTWHMPQQQQQPSFAAPTSTSVAGQTPTSSQGQAMDNSLAEFWDQIAGTSFDWQADPNVPFNI